MVNLPQDLLTVGSNVCDFWICLTQPRFTELLQTLMMCQRGDTWSPLDALIEQDLLVLLFQPSSVIIPTVLK